MTACDHDRHLHRCPADDLVRAAAPEPVDAPRQTAAESVGQLTTVPEPLTSAGLVVERSTRLSGKVPDAAAVLPPLRNVHTASFVDLLNQLGASLLVTTYQAGKVNNDNAQVLAGSFVLPDEALADVPVAQRSLAPRWNGGASPTCLRLGEEAAVLGKEAAE